MAGQPMGKSCPDYAGLTFNNNMRQQPKHSEEPEQQFLFTLSSTTDTPGVPLRNLTQLRREQERTREEEIWCSVKHVGTFMTIFLF